MSLAALSLDDLTYEDLRLMALRRIPAASGGRWSHHAPVDAGVTLLELFAFLLEQQLFVLDQVPDSLFHAILALLGEAPQEAGIARTVVAADAGSLSDFIALAAGTTLRPDSPSLGGLVFSIDADTLLPPVVAMQISRDGTLVSPQLDQGLPVPMMPVAGAAGRIEIDAVLANSFRPEHAGLTVAIAVILSGEDVPVQWAPESADAPPPAPLALDWSAPGAGARIDSWTDGTGGLRRSGLVSFAVPAGMVGADRIRLTLSTASARHAEPPRLAALHLGAALAYHRHSVEIGPADTGEAIHDRLRADLTEQVARLLPNSGQIIDLPDALSPAIRSSLALRLQDATGTWQDWSPVPDLTPVPPEARAFTFDRSLGRISFGDGYTGRVPAPATNIHLSLDIGGGSEGNHPPGMVWRQRDGASGLRLRSVVTATGGTEAESLDAARDRIAGTLSERHRAVTAEDYITLIETAPGIGPHRAHVIPGHDPSFPCLYIADSVTVFVVPRTGREVTAPRADDGALTVIRARLDEARMLTTRVFVARPVFRPVSLVIDIAAAVGDPATFADRLRPVLSDYFHPATGGPDGIGWPFGRALRPSEILRVAEAAIGPEARIDRVGIQLTDTNGAEEDCTELAIEPSELVRLERLVIRVRRDSSAEATL